MSATFQIPEVADNPTGWGPIGDMDAFLGLPYQPFSKGEKVGLAADFSANAFHTRQSTCSILCFRHGVATTDCITLVPGVDSRTYFKLLCLNRTRADRFQSQFGVGDTFVYEEGDGEEFQVVDGNRVSARLNAQNYGRQRRFPVCIHPAHCLARTLCSGTIDPTCCCVFQIGAKFRCCSLYDTVQTLR
jgi:hypothetical protein